VVAAWLAEDERMCRYWHAQRSPRRRPRVPRQP